MISKELEHNFTTFFNIIFKDRSDPPHSFLHPKWENTLARRVKMVFQLYTCIFFTSILHMYFSRLYKIFNLNTLKVTFTQENNRIYKVLSPSATLHVHIHTQGPSIIIIIYPYDNSYHNPVTPSLPSLMIVSSFYDAKKWLRKWSVSSQTSNFIQCHMKLDNAYKAIPSFSKSYRITFSSFLNPPLRIGIIIKVNHDNYGRPLN